MKTPNRKRRYKGGDIIRFEPQDLALVNLYPTIRVAFEKNGCIKFCENIQGYNVQVNKEFSLYFTKVEAKVGYLRFPVSEVNISVATRIHLHGE